MMFGPTKGVQLLNAIAHNVIWANQKADFFVYGWLRANEMFNVTCFPTFFQASDVISSDLLIR